MTRQRMQDKILALAGALTSAVELLKAVPTCPELETMGADFTADEIDAALGGECACQACEWQGREAEALIDIPSLHERVDPGEPMPVGECPKCRCLVHLKPEVPSCTAEARY